MTSNQSFIAKFYPHKMVQKVTNKIKQLGTSYPYQAIDLLNFRILICLCLFCSILIFSPMGYLLAPIITILTYFGIEYMLLDSKIKQRKKQLEEEAIFFFEILTSTLETKKNVIQSLELTTALIDGELSEEFKKLLAEIKLGKSYTESFKNMSARIPSSSIQRILLNMRETDTFGNHMVETLERQINYLKEKRLQKTRSMIAKLPTKISLISTLFLIPLILLLVLAPLFLETWLS